MWGNLCARPSAFPPMAEYADIELSAEINAGTAIQVEAELRSGPRGEKGERGEEGPRGYSAYEIACKGGFVGTEAEWLEAMRQQTATLAVRDVKPLMDRAENAATKAGASETQAKEYAANATSKAEEAHGHASTAGESAKNAVNAASTADAARTGAQDAQRDAEQKAKQAEQSATAARNSAGEATQSAASAEASKKVATTAATNAASAATNAAGSATAAAESARAAAESATAVSGANDSIANYDAHWRAYYQTVTSLPTGYLQGATITAFVYDMPKLTTAQSCFHSCKNLRIFMGSLQALTNGRTFFTDCLSLVVFVSDLSALISAYGMFYGAAFERFDAPLSQLADGTRMYVDCRNLQIFDSELTALSTGVMMFTSCQLNKASSLRVLYSIPAYESGSHPLTIGIHVDNKTDEEVLEAIEGARAKGWTVTVQWNGTATASTFAQRPAPQPPVYVKREKADDGEYEDAAGQRWMVDWGHEVVSPQGEPEALGYELFESVDAALEQWGLVAYVPEERGQTME